MGAYQFIRKLLHRNHEVHEAREIMDTVVEDSKNAQSLGETWGVARRYEAAGDLFLKGGNFTGAQNAYRLALDEAERYNRSPGEHTANTAEFLKSVGKKKQKAERLTSSPAHQINLSARVASVVTIIGLLASIFLFSSNITANIIGNSGNSTYNWLAGILFLIGIISALIYFARK